MKKTMLVILIIILLLGIFYLYLWLTSSKHYDVEYGISFNRQHAESLSLDWQEVYLAMLKDLQPKYIRIAATWSEVEAIKGEYNFVEIKWQMDQAAKYGSQVVLVVGQKAPRWPECHVPGWATDLTDEDYKKELFAYIQKVVELYHNHPALELWQVENEAFIRFRFGECKNFHEDLVDDEIKLVRELDSDHQIMVTDSGELSTWRKASNAGDIFGTTLYRIVRSSNGHIWTYDWLPPAFYRVKARLWGIEAKDMYVAELQAEPWFNNSDPNTSPLVEQMETMSLKRLQKHFDYTERVGVHRAYLWGVEWWYWLKENQADSVFWNLVKQKLAG